MGSTSQGNAVCRRGGGGASGRDGGGSGRNSLVRGGGFQDADRRGGPGGTGGSGGTDHPARRTDRRARRTATRHPPRRCRPPCVRRAPFETAGTGSAVGCPFQHLHPFTPCRPHDRCGGPGASSQRAEAPLVVRHPCSGRSLQFLNTQLISSAPTGRMPFDHGWWADICRRRRESVRTQRSHMAVPWAAHRLAGERDPPRIGDFPLGSRSASRTLPLRIGRTGRWRMTSRAASRW